MAYGSPDVIPWVSTCGEFSLWLFAFFALGFELADVKPQLVSSLPEGPLTASQLSVPPLCLTVS